MKTRTKWFLGTLLVIILATVGVVARFAYLFKSALERAM